MRVSFEDGGGGGPRAAAPRPLARSIGRGLRGRCPSCGAGALFDGFLAIRPICRVCGEELHHHRADDLPPYLTILIVGHVVVSGLLVCERLFAPPVWLETVVWLGVAGLLSLALLRPLKGGVVGLQWALGLHGFGRGASASIPSSPLPFPPKVP
ncbi:MAG: DUF983 domain-containing protein [Phyllobacteriaceae bacterium]|nr:DUF983 domain-containing protein [Phyllobacteriaceae bacterium]